MNVLENWREVKTLFRDSFRSSFHYAIATVAENGEPHVTPIGSLILGRPGEGFYFEKFTRHLPNNIGNNNRVCILAVNSSRWFWVKSLLRGKFGVPPAYTAQLKRCVPPLSTKWRFGENELVRSGSQRGTS